MSTTTDTSPPVELKPNSDDSSPLTISQNISNLLHLLSLLQKVITELKPPELPKWNIQSAQSLYDYQSEVISLGHRAHELYLQSIELKGQAKGYRGAINIVYEAEYDAIVNRENKLLRELSWSERESVYRTKVIDARLKNVQDSAVLDGADTVLDAIEAHYRYITSIGRFETARLVDLLRVGVALTEFE